MTAMQTSLKKLVKVGEVKGNLRILKIFCKSDQEGIVSFGGGVFKCQGFTKGFVGWQRDRFGTYLQGIC